jgi:hypothetical protein
VQAGRFLMRAGVRRQQDSAEEADEEPEQLHNERSI